MTIDECRAARIRLTLFFENVRSDGWQTFQCMFVSDRIEYYAGGCRLCMV